MHSILRYKKTIIKHNAFEKIYIRFKDTKKTLIKHTEMRLKKYIRFNDTKRFYFMINIVYPDAFPKKNCIYPNAFPKTHCIMQRKIITHCIS